MSKWATAAPSQRQLRVGEELRHALAWTLERGEVRDPALDGVAVTVTEVRISPDLKNATVFIVPLGGPRDGENGMAEILAGLTRASSFLRRKVAQTVRLRNTPKLSFQADTSFDEAEKIDSLLRRPGVAEDLAGSQPTGAAAGTDDDGP